MIENPLFYLCLIGLLAKVFASHRLLKNKHTPGAKLCVIFLLVVYAQTVLEIFAFYSNVNGGYDPYLILNMYYALIILALMIIPILFFNIISKKINITILFICGFVFLEMMSLLDSGLLISGAEYTKYSIARIKGPDYWAFQIFVLITLIVTIVSLYQVCKKTRDPLIRVKSANLIIGFVPLLILGIILSLLMQNGLKATSAGFAPIAFGWLSILMAETLQPKKIVDLRLWIPGTQRFKLLRTSIRPFLFMNTEIPDESYLKDYEKCLLIVADEMFSNAIDKQRFLKKSKSTYYRLLKNRGNQPN